MLRRSSMKLPSNAWLAMLVRLRVRLQEMTHKRARSMRRALSVMLYHGNEHDFLLGALLDWARHDKHSLVSEPRSTQMHWRSVYEWTALRKAGVPLGAHDIAERAAFFNYQLIFANYSVHAWYWVRLRLASAGAALRSAQRSVRSFPPRCARRSLSMRRACQQLNALPGTVARLLTFLLPLPPAAGVHRSRAEAVLDQRQCVPVLFAPLLLACLLVLSGLRTFAPQSRSWRRAPRCR
jgi:hypothetical protein